MRRWLLLLLLLQLYLFLWLRWNWRWYDSRRSALGCLLLFRFRGEFGLLFLFPFGLFLFLLLATNFIQIGWIDVLLQPIQYHGGDVIEQLLRNGVMNKSSLKGIEREREREEEWKQRKTRDQKMAH